MGFRPAIEAILRNVPGRERRQTLLFSATMPADVEKIAQIALKKEYDFVDCVGEEENTHQHVPQQFIVCSQEHQVCAFIKLIINRPSRTNLPILHVWIHPLKGQWCVSVYLDGYTLGLGLNRIYFILFLFINVFGMIMKKLIPIWEGRSRRHYMYGVVS